MSDRVAVCPGSFDPFTLGHLDIVRRAAALFDRVIVAVAEDARKDHRFSAAERVEMAEEACAGIPGVSVEAFGGLLVDFCRDRDAAAVVKGLRGPEDLSHEQQMEQINRSLEPELQTIFLLAAPEHSHIRSSMIRWAAELGADVSDYLPSSVAQRLQQDPSEDNNRAD
jgi:pantetheine-phosphate adenylyltransferase